MKKFWKIFGITLGSIVGLVLVVVLVLLYFVFTPARLTPIVQKVADRYILCDHTIGEVDATFFSTFPNFGIRVEGLYLINPMDGAVSDTVVAIPQVVAVINPIKFLKDKELNVPKVLLKDAQADLFVNLEGESNLDVFNFQTDTTDTSAFSLPFETLDIRGVEANLVRVSYTDLKDSLLAQITDATLALSASSWDDINGDITLPHLFAQFKGETYADDLSLHLLTRNTALDLDKGTIVLPKTELSVNEFGLCLNGEGAYQPQLSLNAQVKTQDDWDIPALLALLPPSLSQMLQGIDIQQGRLNLNAQVNGVYNDSVMPVIDATLSLADAQGSYPKLFPYSVKDLQLDATAHLDLNDSLASSVTIQNLHAQTLHTWLTAKGTVEELLADMLCDLQAQVHVALPDVVSLLPKDLPLTAKGTMEGDVKAKIRFSQLQKMDLEKGNITASLRFDDLDATYDSLLIQANGLNLGLTLPNPQAQRKTTRWANIALQAQHLNCQMPALQAQAQTLNGTIDVSNILSKNPIWQADASLQGKRIEAVGDSLGGVLTDPSLQLYAAYNTKDTSAIPTAEAALAFKTLKGHYTDYQADLQNSALSVSLQASKKDRTQPRLQAKLSTDGLQAHVGQEIAVSTQRLNLEATARRNPKYDNVILQWNPRLKVQLQEGLVNMTTFSQKIQIPTIDFEYSNRKCHINDSRIIIGKSDFSLSGEVDNIGKWLRHEDTLTGDLNFVSNYTDVNELMTLTSSDSGSEEESPAEPQDTVQTASNDEPHPFLVPKTVDLTLNTSIKKAAIFDETASNLGGKLYVKNGTLVLEEMGFICHAARLQLTAMYKTPRRNHLYLGLDFHMLDINIEELIHMIPQIDSMVPMLRSFKGGAEFHLAAETYLNGRYDLKTSTTRGACSISGKDLVLLDNETFGKISKLLLFSRKTENKVDSISAEITLFKNQIDIYPFCLSIDNYMAAVGGRHNLDMTFDYHISLLKPIYLGVDVSGNFDDLHIKLAKCRYAQDFRPIFRKEVETQSAQLKAQIKASLQKNVRP